MAKKLLKHYPYVYCPTMVSLFTLNANPKKGDIVIFYRNGTFAHTGIVTSVSGDYFTTIEGKKCMGFVKTLRENYALTEFDEELFNGMVEKITVYPDKYIFEFKDGSTRECGIGKIAPVTL